MTFDEFTDALLEAGWVSRNDAQYENIRKLWDTMCLDGIKNEMSESKPVRVKGDPEGYDVVESTDGECCEH